MGCVPSNGPVTTTKAHDQTSSSSHFIFTIDERLKLKEVWVLVKHDGLKKLGDDIMNRAMERNSSLTTYWKNLANSDQYNNLNFDENDSCINADLLWKVTFKQHGYKLLEKVDQLIMIMVTRISTTDSNDSILNEYFHRIAETHVQYKIKQDHVDIICECILESLKNVMYHHGSEWSIKHALTWAKFFTLITNQFLSLTIPSTTKNVP